MVFWADSKAASCVEKRDLLVLHDLIEERLHRKLPADGYVVIKGPDLISMMESYEGNAKSASCTDQSCMQIARKAQADLYLEQSFACPGSFRLKLYRQDGSETHLQSVQRGPTDLVRNIARAKGQLPLERMVDALVKDLGVQVVAEGDSSTPRRSRVQVISNPNQGPRRGTMGVVTLDCNVPRARVQTWLGQKPSRYDFDFPESTEGVTDARGFFQIPLQVGAYHLRISHPLYESVEQMVRVQPGAVSVQAQLEARFGRVEISTVPPVAAKVDIQSVGSGTSPYRRDQIIEGDYAMTVSHPSYEQVRRTITVARQQTQQIEVRLKRLHGEVVLMSHPSGAQVTLTKEGEKPVSGKTPLAGQFLPTGTWNMITQSPGYAADERRITVRAGRILQSTVTLKASVSIRLAISAADQAAVDAGRVFCLTCPGAKTPRKVPAEFVVAAGSRHRFKLGAKGYVEQTIAVQVGKDPVRRTVTLKKQPVLILKVTPKNAEVTVDGTPCPLKGGRCRHVMARSVAQVHLRAAKHEDQTLRVRAQGDQTVERTIKLTKDREARKAQEERRKRMSFHRPKEELRLRLPRYVFDQAPSPWRGLGELHFTARDDQGGFRLSLLSDGVGPLAEHAEGTTWLQAAVLLQPGRYSASEWGLSTELFRMGQHQASGPDVDFLTQVGLVDLSLWWRHAWARWLLSTLEVRGTAVLVSSPSPVDQPAEVEARLRLGMGRWQPEIAYTVPLNGDFAASRYSLGLDYTFKSNRRYPARDMDWELPQFDSPVPISGLDLGTYGQSITTLGPWTVDQFTAEFPSLRIQDSDDGFSLGASLGGDMGLLLAFRDGGLRTELGGGYKFNWAGANGPYVRPSLGFDLLKGRDYLLSFDLLYNLRWRSQLVGPDDFNPSEPFSQTGLESPLWTLSTTSWGPGLRLRFLMPAVGFTVAYETSRGRGSIEGPDIIGGGTGEEHGMAEQRLLFQVFLWFPPDL